MSLKEKLKRWAPATHQQVARLEKNLLTSMDRGIKRIKRDMVQTMEYQHQREEITRRSYISFKEREDYQECFLHLIRGLDAESVATIARILHRIERVVASSSSKELLDLLTLEERQLLHEQKRRQRTVYQVSDSCYCFEHYLLPRKEFPMSVFFGKCGMEKVEDQARLRNKCIIDAGAYIGDSSIVLAEYTDAAVYAFEAIQENFDLLRQTVALHSQANRAKNIVPVQKALGNEETIIQMESKGGSSKLLRDTERKSIHQGAVDVPVTTVDAFVAEKGIEVGLIKADVEGMEKKLLLGARETITRQKPTLLISIYHSVEDFYFLKPLLESWDLGYRFRVYKGIDKTISHEVMLIAEVPAP